MKAAQRAFWLRQFYQWHWISAALCLIGMLAYAVTGITLNHAADIAVKPEVTTLEHALPEALLAKIDVVEGPAMRPLPTEIQGWLAREMAVQVGVREAEWTDSDIYMSIPGPGGDAWLSIDLNDGRVEYEETFRGWMSYFNDLHKGRDTGRAWGWFIDIFAAGCVVFCVTGLVLLQFHAKRRPSTWPVVGLGFVAPVLLIILFMH
ncbi:PepSY-associated TM helix domain-containing protein [Kordiimonas sp.]|uniref:PepSY-associated TM helix domain-containing protein n=1 Tax=Kordiimonas sp. TaxID=1970157 RepID=UPI003A936C1F